MTGDDAVFIIGERQGYNPKIGVLVSQLTNARHFLLRAVRELSTEQLDAQPPGVTNSIGALLAHLNAAENMFQRITFEGRRFDEAEAARYNPAFRFEPGSHSSGRSLEAYLDDLYQTRQTTLNQLKLRPDEWLAQARTFFGKPANTHYYWFHYLQDEVRHTGQMILIRKHLLPQADPGFNPYAQE